MKRGYTTLEYKQRIRKLREVRPDIAVSSDFIIGFPGETEHDFAATLRLVEEVGFDQSFSFIYSRRPGTPAAALPDDVPHAEKQRRLEILQQRLSANAHCISERMVGTVQRILVERPAKKNPTPARRAHREQSLGQLRRSRLARRPVRRRFDHGSSEEQPAGSAGQGERISRGPTAAGLRLRKGIGLPGRHARFRTRTRRQRQARGSVRPAR